MKNLVKIKKALISLSDKSDLKKILDNLNKYKIEIISSGGTYKEIKKLGFSCKEISDYTGFKEMLDGRIKTLHPKIHAGILSIRSNKKHKKQLKYNNFEEIDLVIVNFYPLEEVVKETINLNKIIKNIDIGGPTLVRAAAKNFKDVAVITSPLQYNNFLNEIKKNKGSTNLNFRHKLASYAFSEIAYYDSVISNCFNNQLNLSFPHKKTFHGKLIEKLRYGENPHQDGSFYSLSQENNLNQLHGKKLSFNNYNDIFSALSVSKIFKKKIGSIIIKHTNPCGVSIEKSQIKSFKNALACDPISSFGGVVAINSIITKKLALELNKIFFEIIISKGFKKDAFKILKKRKNIRLVNCNKFNLVNKKHYLFLGNAFLTQDSNSTLFSKKLKIVTRKKPTTSQLSSLKFAFNICKFTKSNAIVLVNGRSTIGIGAGQPSRLDSCKIASQKALQFVPEKITKSVAASDAFFPFPDSIEELAETGVEAIIQPGGSINDEKVIKAANNAGLVMAFTGIRHFNH